jgi:hypothetical protein
MMREMVRHRFRWRRWRWTLVALASGGAVFGLAAANGHAWEMLWLPGVTVGAAWPRESNGNVKSCLRALRLRSEKQA